MYKYERDIMGLYITKVICLIVYISVDQLLITLLDSGDKEIVYIACGVLINFMVDEEKRAVLKSEGGITK